MSAPETDTTDETNGPENGQTEPAVPVVPATIPVFGAGPPPPPPLMVSLPPLPPHWTQHLAPDGKTPYYYNNATKQSTYVRPLPQFPPGIPPPAFPPQFHLPPGAVAGPSQIPNPIIPPLKKEKPKEKPKEKVIIPGTTWTRVITNQGNVFYTEKESKRSSWTVPEEIKEEVEAYDAELKSARLRKEEEDRLKAEEERQAVMKQRDRIRKELEEESRARRDAEARAAQLQAQEREQREQDNARKRKQMAEEENEPDAEREKPSKLPKIEQEDVADVADMQPAASEGEEQAGPLDDDDEEAWQKAVAAEIAAEHAIEEAEKKAAKLEKRQQEEAARQTVFAAPVKVDLTVDEGKALFMALLHEKDISPFAPWETSLPLFINDPRYILLSSLKDRQDTYEDYCREVARNRRLKKVNGGRPAAEQADKRDPEADYKALLRAEVKSTRMIWDDFRRSWRKDRRFFEYGKEDRPRERLFRQHLKELGERKRADAQRAEADFLDLLREADLRSDAVWKDVKKPLVADPRYDPVGSSTLREELFKRHICSLQSSQAQAENATPEKAEAKRAADRKARAEASLRERETKVRSEKAQLERQIHHSKAGAGREEAEAAFRDLLLQAVRDHDASYNGMVEQLRQDPRFQHAALNEQQRQGIFRERLQAIAQKRLEALHALFAEHAAALDTPFEDVFPEVVSEPAVIRLQLSPDALRGQYETWQRVRFQAARHDFDNLLKENKFVDFWGRMRNKTLEETTVEEDEDHHDAELEGGTASLIDLAKQIDLKAIHDILQNDSRYHRFDHVQDQRAGWIKEWVENLAVAQATVHAGAQQ